MSTLIRGGTVVNHDHSARADVLIDGGKIVGIGEKLSGTTTIDVHNGPGGVIDLGSDSIRGGNVTLIGHADQLYGLNAGARAVRVYH